MERGYIFVLLLDGLSRNFVDKKARTKRKWRKYRDSAVFIEGINVTDEDVHLYSRYEEMTFLYQDHGPIYKLGFRVNF